MEVAHDDDLIQTDAGGVVVHLGDATRDPEAGSEKRREEEREGGKGTYRCK